MDKRSAMVFLALLPGAMALADDQPAAPATAPAAASMSADECAVWERERSFAQSVERHDAKAFSEHVHPQAAFIGDAEATRGRDAVLREWAPIIEGREIVLRWHPESVVIAGDPDIALSRGPYWIEDRDPKAAQPYRVGQFISTWVRGEDGRWQVLFDGGGGSVAKPASAEEVAALKARLPEHCPAPSPVVSGSTR